MKCYVSLIVALWVHCAYGTLLRKSLVDCNASDSVLASDSATPYVLDRCTEIEKVFGKASFVGNEAMSLKVCYTFCMAKKAFYFGVSKGNKCWCGSTYQAKIGGSSICDVKCEGDSQEYCGGKYAHSVYIMGSGPCDAKAVKLKKGYSKDKNLGEARRALENVVENAKAEVAKKNEKEEIKGGKLVDEAKDLLSEAMSDMEGKKPNTEAAKQKRNQAKAKMNEASKIFKKMDSFGGKPTQREQQVRKDLQTAEEILGKGSADPKAFKKALKEAKKELKEAVAKPSAQVVVADSCETTGKCECIPCGTAKPKIFPSGVCGYKSATCSAKSPANPGCYTNCARGCDCAKRAPVGGPVPKCEMWDFVGLPNSDLMAIKMGPTTGTKTTEVHTLGKSSNYKNWVLQTGTGMELTDGSQSGSEWDFVALPNSDLMGILMGPKTGSKKTEVHILSKSSNYAKFALHAATGLELTTQKQWDFAAAPNGDLMCIKKGPTGSGKTEVHILSKSSNYAKFNLHTATGLELTDGATEWDFAAMPNGDLMCIKMGPTTGSKMTEVHILSKSSNFRQFVLHAATGLHITTHKQWSFTTLPNGDLMCIKKGPTTGTKKTEVHILSKSSNYKNWVLQTGTGLALTVGPPGTCS